MNQLTATAGRVRTLQRAGFFAAILLIREYWVLHLASHLPPADGWIGVVQRQFIPWREGNWRIGSLFAAYIQHRMLFQRIWDLTWFCLFHRYDNLLFCLVNNAMFAAMLTMIYGMLAGVSSRGARVWVMCACAFWGAVPFCTENMLVAFQMQVWWMILFVVLGCWYYSQGRPVLCWVYCLCSVFTLAGGFLVAPALLCMQVLQRRLRSRLTLGLVAIAMFGLFLLALPGGYTDYPGNANDAAHTFAEFADMAGRCLSWPFIFHPLACFVVVLPAGLLLWSFRNTPSQGAAFLLALYAWITIEAFAVGKARAHHGWPLPYQRYQDWFALLLPTGISALSLVYRFKESILDMIATAWGTCMLLAGMAMTIFTVVVYIPQRLAFQRTEDINVGYLYATSNWQAFSKSPYRVLPWVPIQGSIQNVEHLDDRPPDAQTLLALLHHSVALNIIDHDTVTPPTLTPGTNENRP